MFGGATSKMNRRVPMGTSNTPAFLALQPWAGARCQKTSPFLAHGEVFFLDIPFYRTPRLHLGGSTSQKVLPPEAVHFSVRLSFKERPVNDFRIQAGFRMGRNNPCQPYGRLRKFTKF